MKLSLSLLAPLVLGVGARTSNHSAGAGSYRRGGSSYPSLPGVIGTGLAPTGPLPTGVIHSGYGTAAGGVATHPVESSQSSVRVPSLSKSVSKKSKTTQAAEGRPSTSSYVTKSIKSQQPVGTTLSKTKRPAPTASSKSPKTQQPAQTTGSSTTIAAAPTSASGSTPDYGYGSSKGLPASSGTSALSAVHTIAAGGSFDGGMVMFDRGVKCRGQEEGSGSDAVFDIEEGGSLSNVIIGPNQIEGVHCQGRCTLTNVWWSAVCEDAFSVKKQAAGDTTKIIGGGAFGASDKVLQHNGAGTISVSGFECENFGKLYRSCGNCKTMYERHVIMDGITAVGGQVLAGINSNYGDTATITGLNVSDVKDICVLYEGNDQGAEPKKLGSGPDAKCCKYQESDVGRVA